MIRLPSSAHRSPGGSRTRYWVRLPLLFGALLLMSACFSSDTGIEEGRLIGRWRSDRGKTLRWIKDHRSVKPEYLKKMARQFGKLTLEFSENKVTMWYENEKNEFDLVVLGRDHDSAAILSRDPETDQEEILLIRFEEKDVYSVYVEPLEIREFFIRIP